MSVAKGIGLEDEIKAVKLQSINGLEYDMSKMNDKYYRVSLMKRIATQKGINIGFEVFDGVKKFHLYTLTKIFSKLKDPKTSFKHENPKVAICHLKTSGVISTQSNSMYITYSDFETHIFKLISGPWVDVFDGSLTLIGQGVIAGIDTTPNEESQQVSQDNASEEDKSLVEDYTREVATKIVEEGLVDEETVIKSLSGPSTSQVLQAETHQTITNGAVGTVRTIPNNQCLSYFVMPKPKEDIDLDATLEEAMDAYGELIIDKKDISIGFLAKSGVSTGGANRPETQYTNHLPVYLMCVEHKFLKALETHSNLMLKAKDCQVRREYINLFVLWQKHYSTSTFRQFFTTLSLDFTCDMAISYKDMSRSSTDEVLEKVYIKTNGYWSSQENNDVLRDRIDDGKYMLLPPPPAYEIAGTSDDLRRIEFEEETKREQELTKQKAIELQKEQERTKQKEIEVKQEEEKTKQITVHETTKQITAQETTKQKEIDVLQEKERTRQMELQLEMKRLELGLSKSPVNKTTALSFQCTQCPFASKTQRGLQLHEGKMHKDHPYVCRCGKSYTRKSSLQYHKRETCPMK